MSVATNNILKMLSDLSDSADNIIGEIKFPPISEWMGIVENKADLIAESETTTANPEEIATLMSYLRGTDDSGPRVSTILTDIQKRHLHRDGKNIMSFRSRKSSIIKTPRLGRKSNLKASTPAESNLKTPKLKVPPTIIKKTTSIFFENPQETVQPLRGTPRIAPPPSVQNDSALKDRSSKRKSSRELAQHNYKKPKMKAVYLEKETENPSERKPMKGTNNSSQLSYANIKSSVDGTAKENRSLRSRIESKQDTATKNRKNIMALRQQKLEENKKTREEKMEKSTQQRMKIEKQKREKTPKAVLKNSVKHDKQTPLSAKKLPPKNIGTSAILKSDEKAALKEEKKNQKPPGDTTTKINTTFAIEREETTTSSFKGKTLKEAKIVLEGGSKAKSTIHTHPTLTEKKGPESYAITPARSSFVSYDISEIRSDSEGEDQESNSKPIPSWATGVRLRNALLQLHHHPIDTDELFGNFYEIPDLARIMGVKKKHYSKRTSSAVWNNSFSFS